MLIYKLIIFIFIISLVSAPIQADTKLWKHFLLQQGVGREIIDNFESSQYIQDCIVVADILICLNKDKYNQIGENRLAKQAISKSMGIKVRNQIYNYVLNHIPKYPVNDRGMAIKAYDDNLKQSKAPYVVKKINTRIEFIGDYCYALAYVHLPTIRREIYDDIISDSFRNDYSSLLLREAQNLYNNKYYSKAQYLLNEVLQLTPNDISAYLLSLEISYKLNNKDDMIKYANILLDKYLNKLNANNLELIGDLLQHINEFHIAEKAYGFSLEKIAERK